MLQKVERERKVAAKWAGSGRKWETAGRWACCQNEPKTYYKSHYKCSGYTERTPIGLHSTGAVGTIVCICISRSVLSCSSSAFGGILTPCNRVSEGGVDSPLHCVSWSRFLQTFEDFQVRVLEVGGT